MKNKNLLIWASDLSPNTGEGILARAFISELLRVQKYNKIKIKTLEQNIYLTNKNLKKIKYKEIKTNSFIHKYLGPIYGSFYLLFNAHKYQTAYINYLPLWNFTLFYILPKKTILGPITGGIYLKSVENFNLFIRKYFFPIFIGVSKLIIKKKFKKLIFSTHILNKYMKKNKFYLFNFVKILFHRYHHNTKKKYDILFYNRNHPTKHSTNVKKILNSLSEVYKIAVIGDYYPQKKVINFGWIKRNEVFTLIKKSKLTFSSAENFFSIFTIDCVSHSIPIIYDSKLKLNTELINNYFIGINLSKITEAKTKIFNLLQNIEVNNDSDFWKKILVQKKKIRKFIFSYFST